MIARPSKRTSVIAAGVAVVVVAGTATVIALTGGDDGKKSASVNSVVSSSAAKPKPKPTPKLKPKPKPKPLNPLTGVGAPPEGPVFAVKVDDTANGRPQAGIDQADIVYVEQAEGGLTRLVGVFASSKPIVEPVRSVRASDPELLAQYGRITLVATGGGGDSLSTLDASSLHAVIMDRGGPAFARDGNRPAPYNVTSDLAQLSRLVRTAGVQDVGFHWASADDRLRKARVAPVVNAVVGQTQVSFVWDARLNSYQRTIGGQRVSSASGAPLAKPNVLVQFCKVTINQADVDVAGNPSQFTHSVGSGRVVLFRNGKRIEGKWWRPKLAGPTSFVDAKGVPLLLAPGGAYVALAANGAPV
jgi:hypothetical protein